MPAEYIINLIFCYNTSLYYNKNITEINKHSEYIRSITMMPTTFISNIHLTNKSSYCTTSKKDSCHIYRNSIKFTGKLVIDSTFYTLQISDGKYRLDLVNSYEYKTGLGVTIVNSDINVLQLSKLLSCRKIINQNRYINCLHFEGYLLDLVERSKKSITHDDTTVLTRYNSRFKPFKDIFKVKTVAKFDFSVFTEFKRQSLIKFSLLFGLGCILFYFAFYSFNK